jgi:hypothetical protein
MGVPIEACTDRASQAAKNRRTVSAVDNHAEVGEFLTSRRANITPQQAAADVGQTRLQDGDLTAA